jgi:hypothetical protein
MSTDKFVGVLLEGGKFDKYILDCMRRRIEFEIDNIYGPVTKKEIAERLQIERNRVTRLARALDIAHLFS